MLKNEYHILLNRPNTRYKDHVEFFIARRKQCFYFIKDSYIRRRLYKYDHVFQYEWTKYIVESAWRKIVIHIYCHKG